MLKTDPRTGAKLIRETALSRHQNAGIRRHGLGEGVGKRVAGRNLGSSWSSLCLLQGIWKTVCRRIVDHFRSTGAECYLLPPFCPWSGRYACLDTQGTKQAFKDLGNKTKPIFSRVLSGAEWRGRGGRWVKALSKVRNGAEWGS